MAFLSIVGDHGRVKNLPKLSFGATAIDADSTTADVAYAVLRKQLALVVANEPGTRLGEDIEALKQRRSGRYSGDPGPPGSIGNDINTWLVLGQPAKDPQFVARMGYK